MRSSRRKETSCSEEELVPVSELRQYHFCPRVVYYHALGFEETPKEYMELGKDKQSELMRRERRRKTLGGLKTLRIDERIEDLHLTSERLCLTGRIDLAVRIGREWAVVEFKGVRAPKVVPLGHRVQGAGYSMLLEEKLGVLTKRFFLLYDRLVEVRMTEHLRRHVRWTVSKVREIFSGAIPEARRRKTCVSCGYRRYCFLQTPVVE